MMDNLETSGRTIEEAIELALRGLDADRGEVEVEVLATGRVGFFGLGAEMARVRVSRLKGDTTLVQSGKSVIDDILSKMGVDAISSISKGPSEAEGIYFIEITGDDSGLLIGRRGETLRAFQFLVNLALNKRFPESRGRVIVDVEGYRRRRDRSLQELAQRVANQVASSGRTITLEPMPSNERRAIHVALAGHPRVLTESLGIGEDRKVSILPRKDDRPRPIRNTSASEDENDHR